MKELDIHALVTNLHDIEEAILPVAQQDIDQLKTQTLSESENAENIASFALLIVQRRKRLEELVEEKLGQMQDILKQYQQALKIVDDQYAEIEQQARTILIDRIQNNTALLTLPNGETQEVLQEKTIKVEQGRATLNERTTYKAVDVMKIAEEFPDLVTLSVTQTNLAKLALTRPDLVETTTSHSLTLKLA